MENINHKAQRKLFLTFRPPASSGHLHPSRIRGRQPLQDFRQHFRIILFLFQIQHLRHLWINSAILDILDTAVQTPSLIYHSPVTFFAFWTFWTVLCRTYFRCSALERYSNPCRLRRMTLQQNILDSLLHSVFTTLEF